MKKSLLALTLLSIGMLSYGDELRAVKLEKDNEPVYKKQSNEDATYYLKLKVKILKNFTDSKDESERIEFDNNILMRENIENEINNTKIIEYLPQNKCNLDNKNCNKNINFKERLYTNFLLTKIDEKNVLLDYHISTGDFESINSLCNGNSQISDCVNNLRNYTKQTYFIKNINAIPLNQEVILNSNSFFKNNIIEKQTLTVKITQIN
jgi:hypothetical protein